MDDSNRGDIVGECAFCAIVAGAMPASVVHDDDAVLAFFDIHPLTRGHLLVIPKRHVPRLADLDDATAGRVIAVALRLTRALYRSPVSCEGVNFFLSDGAIAGQEIFHVHLHVLPRVAGDPFGEGRPLQAVPLGQPTRAELDAIADRVRRAMTLPDG